MIFLDKGGFHLECVGEFDLGKRNCMDIESKTLLISWIYLRGLGFLFNQIRCNYCSCIPYHNDPLLLILTVMHWRWYS